MKKKAVITWIIFVICVIATIGFRYLSDNEQVEYEEVTARVVSAEKKTVRNRSTHSTYTSYEVKVEYDGKEYDLKNAHSAYYRQGETITAYLSRGKLYADVEGVQSSTMLFYAYFAFLVGSVVMFGVALNNTIKAKQMG
ncbi:MAG: penicillin-binding protein [Roseburia sp.]|nr:penicillin-binding protein [Roseburia sp.]